MNPDALRARARDFVQPGINPQVALVLAYADLAGAPLDPWSFDDAAIVLRAETLLLEGLDIATAVDTARAEFTFASSASGGPPATEEQTLQDLAREFPDAVAYWRDDEDRLHVKRITDIADGTA